MFTNLIKRKEFKSHGGKWLGAIRSWIQHEFINGDTVIWGSHTPLRSSVTFTPHILEDLAGNIAWEAVQEDRAKYARPTIHERQFRDMKIKRLANAILNSRTLNMKNDDKYELICPYCKNTSTSQYDYNTELSAIIHKDDCEYLSAQQYIDEITNADYHE